MGGLVCPGQAGSQGSQACPFTDDHSRKACWGRGCQPARDGGGEAAADSLPRDGCQLQPLVGGQRPHTLITFTRCPGGLIPLLCVDPLGPPSLTLSNPLLPSGNGPRSSPLAPTSLSHADLTPYRPYQPPVPTGTQFLGPQRDSQEAWSSNLLLPPPLPALTLSDSPQGTSPKWPPAGPKAL